MNKIIIKYLVITLSLFLGNRFIAQCAIPSLIPNAGLENYSSCPNSNRQITNATSWLATSDFTADYYNCGFQNIASTYEVPPISSSGSGYLGLANQSTGQKQYASSCLSSNLIAGMPYTFQFDIAAANGSSSSVFNGATSDLSYTMVIYGTTSCPTPAYTGSGCPSLANGWQVLASVTVSASASSWTTTSVEFTPPSNIQGIAFGSDCNNAPNNTGLCYGGQCYNYYYFDNLILNLTSLYPTASASADVTNDCTTPSNTISASVTGGTPGFTYSWTPSLGLNNSTNQNPLANPAITTEYIVTITDGNGCQDTDTVEVTVDKIPPTINAGSDVTLDCTTETMVLNATGGDTYSWNPATGLSSSIIGNPTTSATSTVTHTVTGIGTNGCTNTDDITITVDKDLPTATAGPTVSTSCATPDAFLTATGGGTYSWSPDFAISSTIISNPIARPPVTTTYTVTVTASNGCESSASTAVIITTPTPLPLAGDDIRLCGNYTTILNPDITTALPIDQYTWTVNSNNPSVATLSNPNIYNSSIGNLQEGIYKIYFEIDNGICPAVNDSLLIKVYDPPISTAGLDDSLCETYNTLFEANSPAGTSTGLWSLQSNFANPNPGVVVFGDNTTPNSTVAGLQEGIYHFIWKVTNGSCTPARDTIEISVFDQPISNAGLDDSLCNFFTTILSATTPLGTSTGIWTEASNNPSIIIFSNPISPVTGVSNLIEGTYNFIWTVSNGSCNDSIDTVAINVYDTPISDANIDVSICGEDSLYLDTLLFLNGNNPIGTSTGLWSLDLSFANQNTPILINENTYNAEVTHLLEGEYQFVWTVSNGNCTEVTDTVNVLAYDKPISNAGIDDSLCSIYTLDLSATPTTGLSTGTWEIPTNWTNPTVLNFDDILDPTTNTSGYVEGVYKLTWKVNNGNCNPISDTVIISIFDTPFASAGIDIELCALDSTLLSSINPIGTSSGIWSQDEAFNNQTTISFDDDTLNVTNSHNYEEGSYQLVWTVSNGSCANVTDTVKITTYDMPNANAGFDQYLCDLDTVMLNGEGNIGTATGEWKLDPNYTYPSIATFRDNTIKNTMSDNYIVGDYSLLWVINNGVCPSDTDTVVIINMPKPIAIASYEIQQCDNKCFDVTSFSTAPEGDGLVNFWEIDNTEYYDSTLTLCINQAGDYNIRFIVTSSNGCKDSLINHEEITVNPSPFAGFELLYETDSLIELQRVDINNLSSLDVELFQYSMGNGDTLIGDENPLYFYNDFGNYEATQWVENEFTCRDSISIIQSVGKRANIFIPNTFTPNNDGVNDEFGPYTRAISDLNYEFTIFNEWGTMIFKTVSLDQMWNGTYKGETVKDGSYTWNLTYSYENSADVHQEKGHVMVYKFKR